MNETENKLPVILFEGLDGAGKCITGDSIIFTEKGMIELDSLSKNKEIESLNPLNLKLYSKDGEVSTSHFYNDGVQDTLNLTTRFGYEIEGTCEHPLYVLESDGKLKFKKLSEIKEGEYICIQRNQNYFSKTNTILDFKFASDRAILHKLPKVMTEDLARFLGYIIAEGCMTLTKGAFNFTNKDPKVLANYRILLKNLFEITMYPETYNADGKTISIQTNSKQIKSFLNYCGVSSVVSRYKTIPKCVLTSTKQCVIEFLKALFESEASVSSKEIEFSTASKKMSKQLQIVLSNFGIICSRKSMKKCAINGKKIKRTYYRITIRGDNYNIFQQKIGFLSDKKKKKLQVLCNKKNNTNTDIIPFLRNTLKTIYNDYRKPSGYNSYSRSTHVGIRKYGRELWSYIRDISLQKRKIDVSYKKLHDICQANPVKSFQKIKNYDFFFDSVKSIKKSNALVYDFVVPVKHNFTSNSFISHNTYAMNHLKKFYEDAGVPVRMVESIPYDEFMKSHEAKWFNLSPQNVKYMEYMGWQVNNYYNNIAPYIGKEVILIDRFLPSCFAYNALRPDPYSMVFVNIMDKLLKNFFVPDITFWFDIDDDTLSKRHQSTDQPEKMTDLSFMRFVRSEYDRFVKVYASKEKGPYYVKKMDGTAKIGTLVEDMLKIITKKTGIKFPEGSIK